MSGQIVFLSLFLGLISGSVPIDLHVDGPINSVRILLDGREVGTIRQPPWHAVVDFGPELAPRELMAIGYDAGGGEVTRASQIVNLPRPRAEFEIVLAQNNATAELRWRHLSNTRPRGATMTVDGARVTVDRNFRARLPRLDLNVPHVIAAELRFQDGFVARRELVISGGVSESIGTQLTPIAVSQTSSQPPLSLEGCLTSNGTAVRTAAVEAPGSLVLFVREPDNRNTLQLLAMRGGNLASRTLMLGGNTMEEILFPIAQRFVDQAQTSVLFEHSLELDAAKTSVISILTLNYGEPVPPSQPLQFADAVAVAGVKAVAGGRRRAVVLLLSDSPDASRHEVPSVRRYLAALGVPLFVWSLTGRVAVPGASWGAVDDISSIDKLRRAIERVRATLDSQRIAWVAVDPWTALRLEAKPACGMAPLARPAP